VQASRGRRLLGAALTTGLLMITAVALVLAPTSTDSDLKTDAVSAIASVLAFLCCLRATVMTAGPLRRSWLLFSVSAGLWATADVIWLVYGVENLSLPTPSVADALYVGGIVPAVGAMLLFPAGTWERGARSRFVLDVVTLVSGALLCSQLLVLDPVTALIPHLWDRALADVYPVTDIVQLGLAVLLLIRSAGRPRLDLVLVALAFGMWSLTDNGYALLTARGHDYGGTLVGLGYVAAPLLLGLAAGVSPDVAGRPRTIRRQATGTVSALLPDVTTVAAFVLVFFHGVNSPEDWIFTAATLACVLTRQVVMTYDNHGTRVVLEAKVDDRTVELQQLLDRHRRILEAVGEGIVGVDESRRISFVNPAAAAMLGWPAAELEGRDACRALCREEHDHCFLDMVMRLGDVVHEAATEYVHRNGAVIPVEVTAARKARPGGECGAVIAFRDITERLVVDRMKREFVSAVSHELRTPLTAIRGSLEMLSDGDAGELPPMAQPIVDMAARGTERLSRLVNDILEVERLEAGTFEVRPVPQDVGPLVTQTVDSLQPLAADHGVRLIARPVPARALCDADRLVQALTNLVGNAVKFTPAGETVEILVVPGEHEVTFTVLDHGRGIPQDQLDSIFEPFHQVDVSDARDKGGTGLGLTITRSIVERHGGRIAVASTPGVGSTFRFSIPAVRD
jgi:PAS domain S-box-containing protein